MSIQKRITPHEVKKKKKDGIKITMLTAYDYPMAVLVDRAGVDMVLVGDSLANVVLGLDSTREVGMAEMIHHAKAVNRGVKRALLIGDMPFGSYDNMDLAVSNAGRFVEEAGCNAIKLEWGNDCAEIARAIVASGIPVVGHVGLTPQAVTDKKGFKAQGKDAASAKKIMAQAREAEDAGCFCVILECIPREVSAMITSALSIPTIGIGAGIECDGQVLVTHDLLGLFDRYKPKFVKQYATLSAPIVEALEQFKEDVLSGRFPAEEQAFTIQADELNKIKDKEIFKKR